MFNSSVTPRARRRRGAGARCLSLTASPPDFRRLRLEALESRDLLAVSVLGRVWNDANSDGIQTGGEADTQYAVAELINSVNGVIGDSDDVSLGTRITGADGSYQFTGVAASLPYYVVIRPGVGFTFSTLDAGGNDALDSDVSSIGRSALFTPADGATIDRDAGLVGSAPAFGWAQVFGDIDVDYGIGVTTDAGGNTYLTGSFRNTVDFDPGPGTKNLTSASLWYNDTYVSKYTASGALVWAVGSGGSDHDQANAIALGPDGSVVVGGGYRGTVDFDPGPLVSNLTSTGDHDVFVWKLSNEGSLVWARSVGSAIGDDTILGIDVDANGNVAATGQFSGTADFDPSGNTSNLTAAGTTDIFVWSLTSAGNLLWANRAGSSAGGSVGRALTYDSLGNVLVAGGFSGSSVDFDPGTGTVNLSASGIDAFVWKLSPTGSLVWAKDIGGSSTDAGYGIGVDANDNVISAGSFTGTVDFDPGAAVANLVANGTGSDIFVWKLDSTGNYVWAKSAGSSNTLDQAFAVAVDSAGSAVVTGEFFGTVDFDPSVGTKNLTSAGDIDVFVWKLGSAGNLVFADKIGSTDGDSGRGITTNAMGSILATGYYVGTADFAYGAATNNLTGPGYQDGYLARWDVGLATTATVTGRVWQDSNNDGIQTAGEADTQYAVAELINSVNGVIGDSDDVSLGTRITGADGSYQFTGVPANLPYYVVIRPPVGFTFTSEDVGFDALDSDVSSIGRSAPIFPAVGDTIDVDAGLVGSAPAFGWAQGFGAANVEWGIGVTTDAAGNTYLTGAFNNTVDFDPGPGVKSLTSAGSSANDIYVTKYTSAGALVWAVRAGSSVGDEQGNAIAVGADGSVVVTGTMRNTVDFDPGPLTSNLTASGSDVFVWKLSNDGSLIWARRAGSSSSDDGFGIALDSSGNVAVTGSFIGTVDFDPSGNTSNLTAAGSTDIFVWKLDSAGNLVWANRAGRSGGGSVGRSLAYDSLGNLLVTGWFGSGDVDFDPGAGTVNLTSSGTDVFVWKLSPTGSLVWAKNAGASSTDMGFGLAVDANDNVITTGSFIGTADFNPGGSTDNLIANGTNSDIFVWKLTSAGNYVWAKSAGSTNNLDEGFSVAVDGAGNAVVTGDFLGSVDFDPGAGNTTLTSAGNTDSFVWKLSSAGNLVFAEKIGSTSGDSGRGIAVDAQGNIRATGYFIGTADFGPGANTQNLTGPGFQDGYLVRWDVTSLPNQPPTYTKGADQSVDENSGLQTVPGWATGITTGGEAGQSLAFTAVGSSRVDLQACKLEYSIVSPK